LIDLDFKVGEETVVNNVPAAISSKLRRKLDLGASGGEPIKVRRQEREKLTYVDLQIQTPEEFDYENYDRVTLSNSINF
jgi:predicted nucleotidyltransferase component of viral defense system